MASGAHAAGAVRAVHDRVGLCSRFAKGQAEVTTRTLAVDSGLTLMLPPGNGNSDLAR